MSSPFIAENSSLIKTRPTAVSRSRKKHTFYTFIKLDQLERVVLKKIEEYFNGRIFLVDVSLFGSSKIELSDQINQKATSTMETFLLSYF